MKRLLVWLLWVGVVQAQPTVPPVELEASSVFGDIVRYGRPFQARVKMTVNDAALTQDCRLEVGGEAGELTSQMPLRLSPGVRNLTLPSASTRYSPEVSLVGAPQSASARCQMSPSMASDQDFVALTLTPRKNQFSYLGGYKNLLKSGEFRLNQPAPGTDLPDLWWTYLGHDAVVIHDLPSLKLTDQVEQALLGWTQAGGNLVLVTNLDPAELTDSAFEKLAPLRARGVESHGVPMLVGECGAASVVLRHQAVPLLLRRAYGAGWIWQVTASVDSQDVLGTQNTTKLWRELVADQPGLAWRKSIFDSGNQLLSVLPELPAPATAALAWYLAGYVLVVIPGIYVYLRRKDQVLRLIVAVPACSALITVGAYYFNSSGRGRELVLREMGVAWARGGQREVVLDQTGVFFSPSPLRLSLELKSDTLLRPNSNIRRGAQQHVLLCKGAQLELEPERLPQWGISRWLGMGIRRLPQPISMRLELHGTQWQARLDNRSGLPISKAVLLIDSGSCGPVFDLKPGLQEVLVPFKGLRPFEGALSDGKLGEPRPSSEDASSLHREIEMMRGNRPVLVACVEDPLFTVLHPLGVQPKTVRRTYLVVSEDRP